HSCAACCAWQRPRASHSGLGLLMPAMQVGGPHGLIAASGLHDPGAPATLQEKHGPAHAATSQQAPSTQSPELHSARAVQRAPSGLFPSPPPPPPPSPCASELPSPPTESSVESPAGPSMPASVIAAFPSEVASMSPASPAAPSGDAQASPLLSRSAS